MQLFKRYGGATIICWFRVSLKQFLKQFGSPLLLEISTTETTETFEKKSHIEIIVKIST